ncbi:MAG: glycyl-radical enzyme activating protein [Clostridiales Family XIII bacterium]|jgi:pyruvate formate lyase activating enzyme|nr:glycyl-radical enzyme activating protein [Clostridiales Family XIII bacterium]
MRRKNGEPSGLVYNIQKYTIHDGPGIRTEIFFKGCPLSCLWCSNPEGMAAEPEIGVYPGRCMSREKCGWCLKACPRRDASPILFDGNGILLRVMQDEYCDGCLKCAEVCPGRAIMVWGRDMTVPELMAVIEEDRSFYERSGGGVTLNGGEILMQWEFCALLLKACKDAGIGTCAETALCGAPGHARAVCEYADLIITDIKMMDGEKHKKYIGADNARILENMKMVASLGKPLVIRTPVVPGINDSDEEILAIARYIKEELGSAVIQYQLLPYRKMGTEKYATLSRPYLMDGYETPDREVWEPRLLYLKELVQDTCDIPVEAGSSNKLII